MHNPATCYQVLKTDVLADKSLSSLTDQQVADVYNTASVTILNSVVSVSQFAMWATKNGVRGKISRAAQDQANPVSDICLGLVDLFGTGASEPLDFGDAAEVKMFEMLVAGSVMTKDQLAELEHLNDTKTTRAIALEDWGTPVQAPDINAVRNTDPNFVLRGS